MTRIRCSSSLNVDVGPLELAAPLDVDVLRRVDQDVGDRRVGEERLERPEAEQLVADFFDETLALVRRERRVFRQQQFFGEPRDFGVKLFGLEQPELRQIHAVDDRAMQARLDLLKICCPVDAMSPRASSRAKARRAGGPSL